MKKKGRIDRPGSRKVAPDPIKMNYYEMQFDGAEGSTFEERLEKLRQVGKEADLKFQIEYKKLQGWFKAYDQLNLLSFSYYYFMTSRAGYDEEAVTGALEFPPFYQELMQAFALTLPRTYTAKPFSKDVGQFRENFKLVGELTRLKYFNLPDTAATLHDVYTHQLRTQMMAQTTAVRNWAYEHQMQRTTLRLADKIKEPFIALHGFDPGVFLQTLYDMCGIVGERINEHRRKTVKFVRAKNHTRVFSTYESLFPVIRDDQEARSKMWDGCNRDLNQLKAVFLMHSDLFLHYLFSFTYDELEAISGGKISAGKFREIMQHISLGFGDLKEHNQEHFLMGNPVHESPFVKVDDNTIFSTMWSVMTHFSIGLLEKFCSEDSVLRKCYNDARAKFLEESIENLFRNAFPDAEIFAGSKWRGADDKLYENDLLVIIDSFALVVEAKSGQVSPPAKRGATDRLFKTFKELIEDPSEQALRFIDYLKANPKELSLEVEKGPNNRIDASGLKYFIPLGITFSHLGMAGTNLKHLIEAGVTLKKLEELAPSISLTDLEVVFDLLPLQMEKVHYLQRRRELEAAIEFVGDEHDLLAWYLENGFNFENQDKKYVYNMTLKSKELDNYIIGSANGERVKKPGLQMTKWWRDILVRMQEQKFTTWAQSSYILLNFNKGRQAHFEKKFADLKKDMLRKKNAEPHHWISLGTADEQRSFTVIGYNYYDAVKDERREAVINILDQHSEGRDKGKLIIGMSVNKSNYPYSVVASTLSDELFDNRYLGMLRIESAEVK